MSDEVVVAVLDALEATNIPYMVVGSLSVNLYAAPRSTKDADFVIESTDGTALSRLFGRLGPSFRPEPQSRFETITGTTRYIVRTPSPLFLVEIFLTNENDPHDRERFSRRRRVELHGREISAPTKEDVIITKLRWSKQGKRSKDIEDVTNVVRSKHATLDWPYVERWCDQHGTRVLLDEIRRSVPPI